MLDLLDVKSEADFVLRRDSTVAEASKASVPIGSLPSHT